MLAVRSSPSCRWMAARDLTISSGWRSSHRRSRYGSIPGNGLLMVWPIIPSQQPLALPPRDQRDDLLHDLLDRDPLGFRVEIRDDPVPQHRGGHRLDVLDRDVQPAAHEGAGLA